MVPFRTTLLVLTLGSAATLGWFWYPARSACYLAGATSVDGPVILPSDTESQEPQPVPARQRTCPDATPDDWGEDCGALVNLDDLGPDWVAQTTLSGAIRGLIESPFPAWSEPARHAHLLRFTHRFRC
jgi:hypothetical protein